MTAAELAASRAEAERLRRRVASLAEENASLQEAVQLVAAAQKEVTVRRTRGTGRMHSDLESVHCAALPRLGACS